MNRFKHFPLVLLVFFLMIAVSYVAYLLAFKNLIFPRVTIAGIDVSGLPKDKAELYIQEYFIKNPRNVVLRNGAKTIRRFENFKSDLDLKWAVNQAYGVGRNGNLLTQLNEQIKVLSSPRNIEVPIVFDKDEFEGIISDIQKEEDHNPVWPSLWLDNKEVKLISGQNGITVKVDDLKAEVIKNLAMPGNHLIDIPMEVKIAKEDEILSKEAMKAASKWVGKEMVFRGKEKAYKLEDTKIIRLFGLTNEPLNTTNLEELVSVLQQKLETEPRDAVFVFEKGKVKEFKPEVVGAKIDVVKMREKLAQVLLKSEMSDIEVPMIITQPKVTAGEINDLGIKELLGSGTSQFAHSIPGRVFNVNLAASRVNGALIAPGEEFSFNNNVGEISKATGYQSAYIISGGRTVLGDGGGVCQVSTTVFRAALAAGFPITERKAHAYRVGYYEQDSKPGIDATVYYPSADLKFRNDSGKHILVQTTVNTKNLTMKVDIFGTSDGRKSTISTPKIWDQSPPPETMYVDDPTLPSGTMKQIDWSAWGAKVSFDYKVTRGGETLIEKTFYSNYQPWQAVYLRGVK